MAKIASTTDIIYTIFRLSSQEDVDNAIKYAKVEDSIFGLSNDGIFWHPSTNDYIYEHWTNPVIDSYSPDGADFIIFKGCPSADMNQIMRGIYDSHEYAVLTYDTWRTTVGQVAVVTND